MAGSRPAAQHRLERILRHEEYGPKLAKLSGRQERIVLDLIEQNKGRDARKAIIAFDERRRDVARTKIRVRVYRRQPDRTGQNWRSNETELFWRIYDESI
jgi:hypothetical protein